VCSCQPARQIFRSTSPVRFNARNRNISADNQQTHAHTIHPINLPHQHPREPHHSKKKTHHLNDPLAKTKLIPSTPSTFQHHNPREKRKKPKPDSLRKTSQRQANSPSFPTLHHIPTYPPQLLPTLPHCCIRYGRIVQDPVPAPPRLILPARHMLCLLYVDSQVRT
jgi:hypothetical protein